MQIRAVLVSVDYADHLERSISRWATSLASLTVVTSSRDEATAALALRHGCALHRTEAFYEQGAYFNKGRAIEEARATLPKDGWHLFLDADVIPPPDWLRLVLEAAPVPGTLYGARRVGEDGTAIGDREIAGFFQLFHSCDPRAGAPLERDYLHAGNYDSAFMLRWPAAERRILSLELVHLGEPGVNWCGRGNHEAMAKIRESRRRGRSWRRERVA